MIPGVPRTTPADRGGLKAANKELVLGFRVFPYGGDVIYQIGDSPITTFSEILDAVRDKKPGDAVSVHFLRNGIKRTTQIKLSLPPGSNGKRS